MAQWKKLQTLVGSNPEIGKRLVNIYQEKKFPFIDVRGQLADTIELVDWLTLNTLDQATAQMHFSDLLSAMETKISTLQHSNDFTNRLQLQQAKENIIEQFSGNKREFLVIMQKCMRDEKLLIESCDQEADERRPQEERARENPQLTSKINDFRHKLNNAENDLRLFGDHQASFRIEYTSYNEKINQLGSRYQHISNPIEQEKLQKQIREFQAKQSEGTNTNYIKRVTVGRTHKILADDLNTLIKEIWKEIDTWKNHLKLSITGLVKPKDGQIDILDSVCLRVNGFLLQLLNQVDKTFQLFNDLKYEAGAGGDEWIPKIQAVSQQLNKLLATHLFKIFLVDRCPRILKVSTAKSLVFTMSCRLLGAQAFNLQSPPKVTAELHKEQDILNALKVYLKKGMCEIVNGKEKLMDFHKNTNQYIGNFNSVQLVKVKQLDKASDKLVMENRFGMIFYTMLKIRDQIHYITALSPPMALISHVLQECMARAFLVWDSAFSKSDAERIPFQHPQEVLWPNVAKVLNALFKENTGRGLDEDQLNYLGKVAFRDNSLRASDFRNRKISKSQLIKDRLHKDFSFWKWFYANMNLIKDRLKDEWSEGIITGFVSKEEIMEKLEKCEPGTFMLRFSERTIENSHRADICGCLTLAVVEIDAATDKKKIYHVKQHLSPKDIFERGLGITLEAFEVKDPKDNYKRPLLKYLYPHRDFHKTFKKYIHKPKKETDDGDYKSGKLRIEIFLTEESNGLPQRDMTCPMSPFSNVSSPAASEHSSHLNVGSPASSFVSDLDDIQGPFSPGDLPSSGPGGLKSIARVNPQQSFNQRQPSQNSWDAGLDLQQTLNSINYMIDPDDTLANTINELQVSGQQQHPQREEEIVNMLPPEISGLFNEGAAFDAASNIMNYDSGELGSAGDSAGSAVKMNEDGDMEADDNIIQTLISNKPS